MRQIYSPWHGHHVMVGALKASPPPKLQFKNYKGTSLPDPPPECDFFAPGLVNIYGNDTVGDCTCAGVGHILDIFNGLMGRPNILTTAQILQLYSAITGYDPSNPSSDTGADLQTVINFITHNQCPDGSTFSAGMALDATNKTELMQAIYLFKNAYLGISLPDEWTNPFPNAPGFVWDIAGDPNPQDGHCIILYGYGPAGGLLDTWGMVPGTILTWDAIAKYCVQDAGGQINVLLNQEIIDAASQKDPDGLDWATLQADFNQVAAQ